MAARDCLGKIRWVRRLPVHTLLSLETVKDYQLLYFPNLVLLGASHHLVSSIPSRPILAWPCPDSFVRTGFQLTFSCRGSLIGCLINDILHSFFFSFYWDNSQAPDWLQGNDGYQRIAGWAAALLLNPHRWDWHLSGGISSCIHLPRCKADLWLVSRCWK